MRTNWSLTFRQRLYATFLRNRLWNRSFNRARRRAKRDWELRFGRMRLESLETRAMLAADVSTNQFDYPPGSTAIITTFSDGGVDHNFEVGETVQFQVVRTDGIADAAPGNLPWRVTDGAAGFAAYVNEAGIRVAPDLDLVADGKITTDWFVEKQYANASLELNATGLTSGATATVAFHDSATAPTNISLTSSSVAENAAVATVVGTLSATDVDVGDTFTYSLVSGTGSTDNTSFTISGNQLKTAVSFNFEVKSSYAIRIRTTDFSGLWFEKQFTISVTNVNETPTSIFMWTSSVQENASAGTVVGGLLTADPDLASGYLSSPSQVTYALVGGAGSDDNAAFRINADNQLETTRSFDYETKNSYTIRVRATDAGGLSVEQSLTISITNVVEPLASVAITNVTSADRGTTRAQVGDTLRFSYTRGEGNAAVHWTWYTGIDPTTIGNWFGPSRIAVGGDVSEYTLAPNDVGSDIYVTAYGEPGLYEWQRKTTLTCPP